MLWPDQKHKIKSISEVLWWFWIRAWSHCLTRTFPESVFYFKLGLNFKHAYTCTINVRPSLKKYTNPRETIFPGNVVKTASKNIKRFLRSIQFCIFGLAKAWFRVIVKKKEIRVLSLHSIISHLTHPHFTIKRKIKLLIT